MTDSRTTIFKNASVLLVTQLVTWVLAFLLTVVQPRFLGPAATGELYLGFALWAIAGVFISFGMDTFLTKTIARDPSSPVELLGTSLGIRLLFYPLSGAVITLYMLAVGFSWETMLTVHLVGASVFIWQLIGGVQAVLQGLEIMHYISLGTVIGKAINTFFGIAVLLLGFGVYSLAIVMIIAAIACLAVQLYSLNRSHRLSFKVRPAYVLPMLRSSMPYVVGALVHSAYQYINVIFIGATMSTVQVGWFTTASTLFGTLLFLPVAFSTATFPSFSRAHEQNPGELLVMFRKSIDLLLLAGMPIGLGLSAVATPLVQLLYGPEFAPSAPVLQVLGVTLIFMYFNVLIGQYFTAIDRQNTWTICIGLFTVVMLVATMALVPLCEARFGNGAVGAAGGLLLAEAGMVFAGLLLLPRKLFDWKVVWTATRVLCAALLMVGAVWLLREQLLVFQIAGGGLVYVLSVGLFRIVPRSDLELARGVMRQFMARLRRRQAPQSSTSV